MTDLPVACHLTDAEFQQRRILILSTLGPKVLSIAELDNGFRYWFAPHDEILTPVCEIVTLERKCCPFLRFQITVEPGDGDLWLEISGPEGTKEFLAALFA